MYFTQFYKFKLYKKIPYLGYYYILFNISLQKLNKIYYTCISYSYMNVYEIIFTLSTLWVGPFWFAMLLQQHAEKTKKLLSKPLFFLGPIILWFLVMIISKDGMTNFADSFSNGGGFLNGLINTKELTSSLKMIMEKLR